MVGGVGSHNFGERNLVVGNELIDGIKKPRAWGGFYGSSWMIEFPQREKSFGKFQCQCTNLANLDFNVNAWGRAGLP